MPLYRGTRYSLMSSAEEWWLAGGAIPGDNCLEYIEYPSIGQLYVGATVADGNPWTIAITTAWNGAFSQFALDSETGRVILGLSATDNGFYLEDTGWCDRTLFATGTHVYFLVCTGTETRAYRDAVAIGAAATQDPAFGGAIRWRTRYFDPFLNNWNTDIPKAAVYNLGLGSAKRTALYEAMR